MRTDWKHLDKFRTQHPPYTSSPGSTYGAFKIPFDGVLLCVIATDGKPDDPEEDGLGFGWEHVSVHVFDPVFKRTRIPNWTEMCHAKSLFFEDSEVVVQFHVAKADHVNIHDHVLHLWRKSYGDFPLPPKVCV